MISLSTPNYGLYQPHHIVDPNGFANSATSIHSPNSTASDAFANENLKLHELGDPKEGRHGKPCYPYTILIRAAILSAPTQQLSLNEIYSALEARFPYFKTAGKGWRNSIRHNLSLNTCFKKHDKSPSDRSRGSLWYVDMSEPSKTPRNRKRSKSASSILSTSSSRRSSTSLYETEVPALPSAYQAQPLPFPIVSAPLSVQTPRNRAASHSNSADSWSTDSTFHFPATNSPHFSGFGSPHLSAMGSPHLSNVGSPHLSNMHSPQQLLSGSPHLSTSRFSQLSHQVQFYTPPLQTPEAYFSLPTPAHHTSSFHHQSLGEPSFASQDSDTKPPAGGWHQESLLSR